MKDLPVIKDKNLRRKGFVLVGDILLPIHTKGMMELRKTMRKLKESQNFPIKIVTPEEDEKRALIAFGYDLSKLALSIKRIDETSAEYKIFEEKMDKMTVFLQVAINVDLDFLVETGEPLWQHLSLEDENDYIGMAEWLAEIGMEKQECEELLKQIEIIKNMGIKDYSEWITKTGLFKEFFEDDNND